MPKELGEIVNVLTVTIKIQRELDKLENCNIGKKMMFSKDNYRLHYQSSVR